MMALNVLEKDGLTDSSKVMMMNGGGHNGSTYLFLSQRSIPNMGDLAVFGTLRGLQGLPIHTHILSKRDSPIPEWYERMNQVVHDKSEQK